VGKRLLEVREASGLNQTQFAHLMGYSHQRWLNYEKGHRMISVEALIWLHDELGVSLNWLIIGTGRKAVPCHDVLRLDKR
jgi:transcriptional regulator with XRE-family HTH domain